MKLRTATLLLFLTAGARSEVEHKTRFDSEMVPGIRGQEVTFPLSNSRQLVRTGGGQWLLVFDVPADGLYVCYGPPGRTEGSRFSPPLLLVGNGKEGVLAAGVRPAGVSLAIAGDRLFLAWSDQSGVWAARISLPRLLDADSLARALRQARPAELVSRDGAMGDIALDPSGRALLAWSSGSGVFVSIDSAGHWQAEKAAPSGSEPVVEFDKAGRLHMAYRHQREVPFFGRTAINPRIYYTVREKQGWRQSQVAAQGLSFHPAMALDRDRPIVGFQHEGMKAVSRAGDRYLDEREGGGASVGYAANTDSTWQTGFVSQAHEIITRDSTVADAYKGRIYPMVEQKWRPRMAIDKYDVPWVFWPDTTRRHTYFARWLGSAFSDEYECRGGYYAPSEYITVEKHMPASASEIGFAYAAAGRLYFGTQPVPSATTGDRRHFLFLDLLDFSEMRGVDQVLNRFTKYHQNPVFGPGDPGSWDDYGISFPNVRYDRGKFMMEYSGHGIGGTAGAWNHGYAESQDGIHWSRPKLGLTESRGSRDNNLIPWVPNFLDTKEPDPARRYKGVLVDEHWITDFSRRIAYSPDAIHWTYGQETVNLTSMLEGAGPSFRDELDIPERRFKSVGRTLSQGHRALGMMWSPDLIHWYGDEAILDVEHPNDKPALQWRGRYVAGRILDPSAERGGDQIYWGTVWIENGIYLCLYAPFQYDGGYQGGLAMSRDGVNYTRVKNGEFILPRGPAGTWDSGFIAVGYGINVPLRIGDTMRVYYGGVTSHHGTDPWRASAAIGMAELPADGWVYVSPSRAAAASYVTTIPFGSSGAGKHLRVNAEVPQRRGSIRVELLDSRTNQPLAGYSRQDCDGIVSGGRGAKVTWKGSDSIPATADSVRFRFYLDGAETRLFSFWFD